MQQIQATDRAFAAILPDGTIETWGDAFFGGDGIALRDQVQHFYEQQAKKVLYVFVQFGASQRLSKSALVVHRFP